jgi:hypothetical protein
MKRLAFSTVFFAISMVSLDSYAFDRMRDGFPDLPKTAREIAERSLACQHFWGEVNGTGDERDKDVARTLKELKCDRVVHDLKKVRAKYRNNPKISKILDEATIE